MASQTSIDQLERACRAHGLAVTVQRRAVFEAIAGREDHPTADQIYDQIRKRLPGVSRTTVYRILDTFVELGLIARLCHPGSAARFDPKTERHHHLVCTRCEAVIDFDDERLDGITWPDVRRFGFEIEDHDIHFRGVCAGCRRLKEGRRAGRRRAGKESGKPAKRPTARSGRRNKAQR